ncbi:MULTISPECIES: HAD-IIB family hydrolase [Hyphomicrobium]|jgi:HAD superfamily hydrolase (TIGR01484 family)|uniref:HAD-IIB family hydrolase n=1 Tax=Hyphomicrobium TaxID=81 RepID=UPI00037EB2A4|nr:MULTISPECIES: HAD-IIB family hydrolase [Hyphomicrobium]WBT40232.1 HAD-IIB family hydrolase [Hyphomicrobium sp. DMF-1]
MRPISAAASVDLRGVQVVLTDMDDTLTFDGKLSAETYDALERLEAAGVRVIPVTAAPAGWCDQMVRMWPVTAVIGENGGFCFSREGTSVTRRFWSTPDMLEAAQSRLADMARTIMKKHPELTLSDDQPFRRTSLALARPDDRATARAVLREFEARGASATANSLWVIAWFGGYNKVTAVRKFLPAITGLDIDLDRDRLLFVGDSANDAPMFAHMPKSVGVSTVTRHLADIPHPPTWITKGAGGAGFVEVADAILANRPDAPAKALPARSAESH